MPSIIEKDLKKSNTLPEDEDDQSVSIVNTQDEREKIAMPSIEVDRFEERKSS